MSHELRMTMGVEEFAQVVGISKNSAYAAAKDDRLPVPVIRIGRRMLISRAAVQELLAARSGGQGLSGTPAA